MVVATIDDTGYTGQVLTPMSTGLKFWGDKNEAVSEEDTEETDIRYTHTVVTDGEGAVTVTIARLKNIKDAKTTQDSEQITWEPDDRTGGGFNNRWIPYNTMKAPQAT